jgi:hypothetical protein
MIANLLLRFGLVVVSLDLVARQLASDVLRTHDVDILDGSGTLQFLRRRYVVVAVETGLPVEAQAKVAQMAWQYIVAARAEPAIVNRKEFSFYS